MEEKLAHVAQLAEHILGKDEVSGSIPLMGSIEQWREAQNNSSRR